MCLITNTQVKGLGFDERQSQDVQQRKRLWLHSL